jgi:hypothetical protein
MGLDTLGRRRGRAGAAPDHGVAGPAYILDGRQSVFRNLWNEIVFVFTWQDLSGRRHLRPVWRPFVGAVGLVVVGLVALLVLRVWEWERPQERLFPGPTPTPAPTPTKAQLFTARLQTCPADPAQWTLEPLGATTGGMFAKSALRKLEPACARDFLAREIAFTFARNMGYLLDEVEAVLGIPVHTYGGSTQKRMVVSELGPREMSLTPPLGEGLTAMQIWSVGHDGQFQLVAVLAGCYRGLQGDYPYECLVRFLGRPAWRYIRLEEMRGRAEDTIPWEGLNYFGYKGDGRWELLGAAPGPEVSNIVERLNLYQALAAANGVEVWDAAWLERTFGITMRPVPPDAQTWATDDESGRRYFNRLLELEGQRLAAQMQKEGGTGKR